MVDINERAVSRLASKYQIDAKIVEPRIFFDRVTFDGTNVIGVNGPNIFRNGFKYPLQILYVTAAMCPVPSVYFTPVLGDERMVQKYGLRIIDHGSFYMDSTYIPLPLWHNQTTAAADIISRAVSVWEFDYPFEMASRDAMEVRVSLEEATATTRTVGCTFEGYGKISKVPYIFPGSVVIAASDGTGVVNIDSDQFRNEGLEPVVIKTMTINCGPDDASADPEGDIRLLNISVRQIGYGTNQQWVGGPVTPLSFPRAPASLLGLSQGRCVTHRLPKQGWIWEPNEGVTIEVQQQTNTLRAGETVLIGMMGYLLVP